MGNTQFFIKEAGKLLNPKGLDTLIHFVTSRCNAKCGFCFYGDELNRIDELDLSTIETVTKKLKSLKALLIGGGEPFLRTDLFDIVKLYVENCGIEVVQIPTNGFFTDRSVEFSKKILSTFPKLNLSIQVSLDTFAEEHDRARVLKDSFQRAEQTLKDLIALQNDQTRLRVFVVSVLTPENIGSAVDFAKHIRENINPNMHWFEPVRDMPEMIENLSLTKEVVNSLRDNLSYYLKEMKGISASIYATSSLNNLIRAFSLNNYNIAYNNFLHQKQWPMMCVAGRKMAVLYPDGELAACELRNESVRIENFDYDINKALASETFNVVRNDIKQHKCDCTHGCFITVSARYSPKHLSSTLWQSLFSMK